MVLALPGNPFLDRMDMADLAWENPDDLPDGWLAVAHVSGVDAEQETGALSAIGLFGDRISTGLWMKGRQRERHSF